jgi:hypothetical protein
MSNQSRIWLHRDIAQADYRERRIDMLSRQIARRTALQICSGVLLLAVVPNVCAAAVGDKLPYQASKGAQCSGNCGITFPAISNSYRIDIEYVSCSTQASGDVLITAYLLRSMSSANAIVMTHALPLPAKGGTNANPTLILSAPVVQSIPSGGHAAIAILISGGTIGGTTCSISGTKTQVQ